MPPRPSFLRLSLVAVLLAGIGDASAFGLGEMRTHSTLGERLVAEVEVLTSGKETIDSGCFRLRPPPPDADLPWLKRAVFNLRKGTETVLEIRSEQPLRDPVLQVGILVGCGHEIRRDYTLLLSPPASQPEPPRVRPPAAPAVLPAEPRPVPRKRESMPMGPESPVPPPAPVLRRTEKQKPPLMPDRLVLSDGERGGDPSLRLATELASWKDGNAAAQEAQREVLRLEFRLLTAMNEQAISQLAAAEKLRNMEATLGDLHQRGGEFANRMEKGVPPADAAQASAPPAAASPTGAAAAQPQPRKAEPETLPSQPSLLSEWSFYGTVLGAMLGVGGWLGWRQYRQRHERPGAIDDFAPEPVMDPLQPEEREEPHAAVDLHLGPESVELPTHVDVPLDLDAVPDAAAAPAAAAACQHSVPDATVDEQFEANPVMELAEIMLSFGRVKGAAQALQEYIDHNPEEALQPWIRLMDVYRMAGMREEFERLARELNQHFNVEIQQWEPGQGGNSLDEPLDFVLESDSEVATAVTKAMTLEGIEHICRNLVELWNGPDCLEYLHQLLRDNRGGKRSGFTLPVVEEILFLIELQETRNMLDKQSAKGVE